jgi:hypothetical protein
MVATTSPVHKKKRKKLSPAERRLRLRDQLWPGAEKQIWHRLENDGYITIPKVLSLVCALLKEIADNDPTRVYLDLWCRSWDEAVIEGIDEDEAAFSSGYVGTRAKRTWTEHMDELEKLGFIRVAPNGNNRIGHILIRNPLLVVEELRARPKIKVPEEWWNAFLKRVNEVGAVLPSEEQDEDAE